MRYWTGFRENFVHTARNLLEWDGVSTFMVLETIQECRSLFDTDLSMSVCGNEACFSLTRTQGGDYGQSRRAKRREQPADRTQK